MIWLPYLTLQSFMASSLSNHFKNLAAGTHKFKCKYGHDITKCETCGIKYKNCECCLKV